MAVINAPPVSSPLSDVKTGMLALVWLNWVNLLYNFVKATLSYTNSAVQVPLTGFSITMGNTANVLTLNPAGTLATGAVTMAPAPVDGLSVEIASTKAVSSFTLSANVGQTIMNAPTALAAGVGVGYYYNAALSTWFRRY